MMDAVDIKNRASVRIRYAETDKMGVVYNSNYFIFFEVGRVELMRSYGMQYSDLEKAGYYLPLVESYAKYINSAYYDDYLEIEVMLKWDFKPILKFEYSIYRNDELITTGFTTHCFMSTKTMKPVRPPKVFVDSIVKFKKQRDILS